MLPVPVFALVLVLVQGSVLMDMLTLAKVLELVRASKLVSTLVMAWELVLLVRNYMTSRRSPWEGLPNLQKSRRYSGSGVDYQGGQYDHSKYTHPDFRVHSTARA